MRFRSAGSGPPTWTVMGGSLPSVPRAKTPQRWDDPSPTGVPAGVVPRKLPGDREVPFVVDRAVAATVDHETPDVRVGCFELPARRERNGRPVDLHVEHGVGPLRQRQRVGGGAWLRVSVDCDRAERLRKPRRQRDRVDARTRDVEVDRVGPGRGLRVEDRLAKRPGTGVDGRRDGEGRGPEPTRRRTGRGRGRRRSRIVEFLLQGSRSALFRNVAICPRVFGLVGQ